MILRPSRVNAQIMRPVIVNRIPTPGLTSSELGMARPEIESDPPFLRGVLSPLQAG